MQISGTARTRRFSLCNAFAGLCSAVALGGVFYLGGAKLLIATAGGVCALAAYSEWSASKSWAATDFYDQSSLKFNAVFAGSAALLLGIRMFIDQPVMNWLTFTCVGLVGVVMAKECVSAIRDEREVSDLEPDTSSGVYITGFGAALALAGAAASVL